MHFRHLNKYILTLFPVGILSHYIALNEETAEV